MGVISIVIGIINQLITGGAPPCRYSDHQQPTWSHKLGSTWLCLKLEDTRMNMEVLREPMIIQRSKIDENRTCVKTILKQNEFRLCNAIKLFSENMNWTDEN